MKRKKQNVRDKRSRRRKATDPKQVSKEDYNPLNPAAYSAIDKLSRATRKPRKEKIHWLEHQDAYNWYKLARKRFSRRFYNVLKRDDLADMQSIKTYNDGISHLLVVIDVLSKFSWVEMLPVKEEKVLRCVSNAYLEEASNGFRYPFNQTLARSSQRKGFREF